MCNDVVHQKRSIMGNVVAFLLNGNSWFKFNNAHKRKNV